MVAAITLESSSHCEEINSLNLCICSKATYARVVGPHWKFTLSRATLEIKNQSKTY